MAAPLSAARAEVEYGSSAAANVILLGVPEIDSEQNLEGTTAQAHVDALGILSEAAVTMSEVECLSDIPDVVDSDAWTDNTFFWDTFTVSSWSLPRGTATTVTFLVGLNAGLRASSRDLSVSDHDVVSILVAGVYGVTLTNDVPVDNGAFFVGTASLDAVLGLTVQDDLRESDFTVEPVSGATGYSATLSGFTVPITVETTVGSRFSLKFAVSTLASVAPGLSDGIANADLQNSLRIVSIETDDGVHVRRASEGTTVPLQVAPILIPIVLLVGAAVLRQKPGHAP
jgi:hypothetical protein